MNIQRVIYLLSQSRQDRLSADEQVELEMWRSATTANEALYQKLQQDGIKEEVLAELDSFRTEERLAYLKNMLNTRSKKIKVFYPSVAAAGLLLIASIVLLLYWSRISALEESARVVGKTSIVESDSVTNVMLTLSDGSQIVLDAAASDTLLRESGIRLRRSSTGEITYEILEGVQRGGQNSIHTPVGSQYKVVLTDGTKVWLNALSSITYPVDFMAADRRIKVEGEAYFEVEKVVGADGKKKPFTVDLAGYKIAVLGTKFNVKSYADEPHSTTTLVEGRVKILNGYKSVELLPGYQARIATGQSQIKVEEVDVLPVISWKEGYFSFEQEKITAVMNEIARWYGVEVVYLHNPKDVHFAGRIPKHNSLEQVLEVLELTGGCKFKREGRRVLVMN